MQRVRSTGLWLGHLALFLALYVSIPLHAQGKTDVVTLANGDRITGEVKRLDRGRLEFSTDDAGTLYLEWDKLASAVARRRVEVVWLAQSMIFSHRRQQPIIILSLRENGAVMRYRLTGASLALCVVAFAATAQAQEQKTNFIIGGGVTIPNGEVRDRLGDGYNFNIGLQVNLTPIIAIEGLYGFNGLGSRDISIPVYPSPTQVGGVPTNFEGSMNMQFGTLSLIAQAPDTNTVRPYGLVGMGVYYRPIKVTTPSVGYVPGYCNPWWYVCYPGGWVETERIIGERSSTDFGMGVGGGVNFGKFFAELRYHYIWGPEIEGQGVQVQPLADTSQLAGQKANGQFLTTTFGFRF